MKDLAIYGAGGFGREVALLIDQINQEKKQWNFIGFFDDGSANPKSLPIVGHGDSIKNIATSLDLVVAVADPTVRKSIVSRIQNKHITFPVIIHPQGDKGASTNLFGRGTIVTKGTILTTGISLGDFVIVNLATTIGHDARIGNFCSIMPGTNISGNVSIGECSLIGTGAKILQNLSIGANVQVGAGAVVVNNVADGEIVIGVPAKPQRKNA
jgi:sugar O-acyltransferase (sialic acid O-acetyltransferase NeuD family)